MDTSRIVASTPNFFIRPTVHHEDIPQKEMIERANALLEKTIRAEKMLDILDFTFHIEDYDLRHSWSYWEDKKDGGLEIWPGAFAAGKLAFLKKTRPQLDWKGTPLEAWALR